MLGSRFTDWMGHAEQDLVRWVGVAAWVPLAALLAELAAALVSDGRPEVRIYAHAAFLPMIGLCGIFLAAPARSRTLETGSGVVLTLTTAALCAKSVYPTMYRPSFTPVVVTASVSALLVLRARLQRRRSPRPKHG